jgi:hypothetical protein
MTRDEANRIVTRTGCHELLVDALVGLGVLKVEGEPDLVEELCTDLNNKIHPPERWVPLAYMKDSLRILKLKLVRE